MLKEANRAGYRISTFLLRWYYRRLWGMTIGRGVRISTSTKLDQTNPNGVRIGDYTALAFRSAVLTHDFVNGVHRDVVIGSHCLIGANAIIMPGVRIGDHCIVGPGSVVFVDVPPHSCVLGNPARVVENNIETGKWGIRNPDFLVKSRDGETMPSAPATDAKQTVEAGGEYISSYLADVGDMSRAFEDLGIDSFRLVTLRAEIEETEGAPISDDDWTRIERPSDLVRFLTRPKAHRNHVAGSVATRRLYEINMPQMAIGGLSEAWLFKEIGDVHWSLITSSFGLNSRDLADEGGERLYPTFTRVRFRSTMPLAAVKENDRAELTSTMNRFGAGMYFSTGRLTSDKVLIEFDSFSSFSRFGEPGSNTSLVKSQPRIPEQFPISSLSEAPVFANEYKSYRSEILNYYFFETEYEIIAQHDINGVGLLYFAAYPVIFDICLMRYLGPDSSLAWTPRERDVCYFANSGPSDRLIFRLHADTPEQKGRRFLGSLHRKSDGQRMARVEVLLSPRSPQGEPNPGRL